MHFLKIIPCFFFFTIITASISAQRKTAALEVMPYARMDWYPEFTYSINSVNNNKVKIRGESFGINVNYKYPWKDVYVNIGIGYYKYAFNKITQKNSLFDIYNNNRTIDYSPPGPTAPAITYATNKYWYHTISLNTGIQKYFEFRKGWQLSAGINLANYFTIAQTYHIRDFKDKSHDFRYFGFSAALEFGLIKKFNKVKVGPTLILPVYDLWKQDNVFPKDENSMESNSATRDKWFRGIGLGISIRFPLGKK